jgi:hypothetical protein
MRLKVMRSLLILLITGAALTCGCSSAPAVTRARALGTHQQLAAAAASTGMPTTIRAVPMQPGSPPGVVYIRAGTPVSSADIGARAATSGDVVFGLADQGSDLGAVWPAISTDAGKHWRIDGPLFYFSAAQGPSVTDSIGAQNPDIAWAWGAGGNFVKVATDRGHRWWKADFPAGVDTVTWQDGCLQVRALGNTTPAGQFQTFLYISADNGRTWTLHGELGNISA